MKVEIAKSDRQGKKFKIVMQSDGTPPSGARKTKTIHIGQAGADDFTLTGDTEARKRYITRHKKREDWTKSGINTAGFWAYHLLWRFRTKQEAVKKIEKQFNLKISFN